MSNLAHSSLRKKAVRLSSGPRLFVLVAILASSGVAIGCYSISPAWLLVPSMVALAVGWLCRPGPTGLALSLLPLLAWGYVLLRLPRPGPDDLSSFVERHEVIFRAQVTSIRFYAGSHQTALVVAPQELIFPLRRRLSGLALLSVYGGAVQFQEGDLLEAKARLSWPERKRYPWQMDYADYLRRRRIFALATAQGLATRVLRTGRSDWASRPESSAKMGGWGPLSWVSGLCSRVDAMRTRMVLAHRRFIDRAEGDLLSSMVLGDRAVELPAEIERKFRDVGLSHVLAASGFNLTIVTAMTWWLGRLLLRSPWVINLLCFLSMLVFVCLAGPSPSVVRAALMCSLVLLSRSLFRSLHAPAALAFALLTTLIIDPLAAKDVGLQLSYAATTGIVAGVTGLSRYLSSQALGRWPPWFAETVSVVVVAQASVLPIQLFYFWQIGLFFLPANLLIAPLVPLVTVLGFLSSLLVMSDIWPAGLDPVAWAIDHIAVYPLRLIIAVVSVLASCEWAKLHLGPPTVKSLLAYYACLLWLFLSLHTRQFRLAALSGYLLALAALIWRPPPPALTLSVHQRSLVMLDGDRQALCLGNDHGNEIGRFLAFFGARAGCVSRSHFQVQRYGAATVVEVCRAKTNILILNPDRNRLDIPGSIPPCAVAVIWEEPTAAALAEDETTGSGQNARAVSEGKAGASEEQAGRQRPTGVYREVPGSHVDGSCYRGGGSAEHGFGGREQAGSSSALESVESGWTLTVKNLSRLVVQARVQWLVVAVGGRHLARASDRLVRGLAEIPGLKVLLAKDGEAVLTSSDGQFQELPAMPGSDS